MGIIILMLILCIMIVSMVVFVFRIVDKIRDENLSEEDKRKAIRNNVIGIFVCGIIAVIFTFSILK